MKNDGIIPETLRIASRSSPLALVQVDEVLPVLRQVLPEVKNFVLVKLESPGDQNLRIDLSDPTVPDDFFTRHIDDALLEDRADLSVHSAKDLPAQLRAGLVHAALLPARDIRDALVVRPGLDASAIRVIGTSSPRRSEQLKALYPAAALKAIRGTIQGRLDQLDRGEYDAVVIAACALERLGISGRIHTFLPFDPAPQQGRLAIVCADRLKGVNSRIRRLDVRLHAAMAAVIGMPENIPEPPVRARSYIRRADLLLVDEGIPDDHLKGHAGQIVHIKGHSSGKALPQSEINRMMLHASEQGRLVVRIHQENLQHIGHLPAESEFLRDWNIRTESVTLSNKFEAPRQNWTLFTGTNPDNFLKYGPLIEWPMIELAPLPLSVRAKAFDAALDRAEGIIFPSTAAVEAFFGIFERPGSESFQPLEKSRVGAKKIFAVGPATAEALRQHGAEPSVHPENFDGIRELFARMPKERGVLLYPCSTAAPVAERMESAARYGFELLPVRCYENRPRHYSTFPDLPFDRVLFTSPSTARAYFDLYPQEKAAHRIWLAIGPATQEELERLVPGTDIMEIKS